MPRLARMNALWILLPALLFTALQLRTVEYPFVWTDLVEYQEGTVLRPPGQILEAFREPLHRTADPNSQVFAQPYYRPLQVVTASLVAAHVGREPSAFRWLSILLGAATLALFTALAWELFGSRNAALVAGSVAAVHPANLEIYLWVGGLSAAWVNLWIVGSVWLALRAFRSRGWGARIGFAALGTLALVAGLLSKESAAVTPALVGALALGEWRRTSPPARGRLLATAGVLVTLQLATVAGYVLAWRPQVLPGALTGAAPLGGGWVTQLASSLAFWPEVMAWLFFPLTSNTSDAVRIVGSLLDPAALAGAGLAVACLALIGFLLARGRSVAAFALAWVWLAFAPVSGVVPLLHARAERNLFLSLYGAALLWAFAGLALRRRGAASAVIGVLSAALVLGLAQRTWSRQPDWRSTTTLFERDVGRDPRHREGRTNLVIEYYQARRIADAKREVDILVAQRAERHQWSSYGLDERTLELACLVNEIAESDRDTLSLYDAEFPGGPRSAWGNPGFFLCAARALERSARPADAAPLFEQLYSGSGRERGAAMAVAAARCHAKLGHRDEARSWLDRVPPAFTRRGALAPEIRRVRRLLRGAAPTRP